MDRDGRSGEARKKLETKETSNLVGNTRLGRINKLMSSLECSIAEEVQTAERNAISLTNFIVNVLFLLILKRCLAASAIGALCLMGVRSSLVVLPTEQHQHRPTHPV